MGPVDVAAVSLLALGMLRGLWIGAIREAFSFGALAAAAVAVRLFGGDAAWWLERYSPVALSPTAASIAAGVLLAVLALLAVGLTGRLVRRGIRAVGLGMLDRLAGAALGAAEGALLILLALFLGTTLLGHDHPALTESRTLQTLHRAGLLLPPKPNKGDVVTYLEQKGHTWSRTVPQVRGT